MLYRSELELEAPMWTHYVVYRKKKIISIFVH